MVVTRPVRQGRLKLALEEVLSMTVDIPTSRSGPVFTSPHRIDCRYVTRQSVVRGKGFRSSASRTGLFAMTVWSHACSEILQTPDRDIIRVQH